VVESTLWVTSPPSEVTTFYVVAQEDLMEMLKRAHAGEDPDTILLEFYANTTEEPLDG
jgi:hypothetical protein